VPGHALGQFLPERTRSPMDGNQVAKHPFQSRHVSGFVVNLVGPDLLPHGIFTDGPHVFCVLGNRQPPTGSIARRARNLTDDQRAAIGDSIVERRRALEKIERAKKGRAAGGDATPRQVSESAPRRIPAAPSLTKPAFPFESYIPYGKLKESSARRPSKRSAPARRPTPRRSARPVRGDGPSDDRHPGIPGSD
jgi:hypothetical protein